MLKSILIYIYTFTVNVFLSESKNRIKILLRYLKALK